MQCALTVEERTACVLKGMQDGQKRMRHVVEEPQHEAEDINTCKVAATAHTAGGRLATDLQFCAQKQQQG